ncbi:MAG: DUF3050 domain-containing protein [Pirellulaceae bacterium]
MIDRPTDTLLHLLETALSQPRRQLLDHAVYPSIRSLPQLRVFMEHHIYAVWDFMTLLKALQRQLTSVATPWIPTGDPVCRRLINEIVLGEESDEAPDGAYASHFELYREAMLQCGAEVGPIDELVACIRRGDSILQALESARAPAPAAEFVRATWSTVASHKTHAVAAAFTFGREEVIPDMFRRLVADLNECFPGQLEMLQYYLERHIALDEDHHAPLAKRMLTYLCGEDEIKWREATEAAVLALKARVALWDGVAAAMSAAPTDGQATGQTTASKRSA